MILKKGLLLLIVVSFFPTFNSNKLNIRNLSVLHEWRDLVFEFPSEVDREFAVRNGLFVDGVGIPIDFDVHLRGQNSSTNQIFVTIPRLSLGIPFSLGTISDKKTDSGVQSHLLPYPDYGTHTSHGADCNGITSAIRVFIDDCQRLWVVDSGQIVSIQFCPPQIHGFDLHTNKRIHHFILPQKHYVPGISVFTSLVADTQTCENTKLYIADSWGFGLIVYDVSQETSWRIENRLMRPGNRYQRDGIFSLTLSPRNTIGERNLFFHTLASNFEVFVPLQVINNKSIWSDSNVTRTMNDFKILGNRKIQCESEAMDSLGNLYCSVLSLNSLIRWDSRKEYNSDSLRIYAYNPEQIKFVTGMKVLKNSLGEEELWILSNDSQLFSGATVAENEIKFRLIGCRISDLLSGRKCTVEQNEEN